MGIQTLDSAERLHPYYVKTFDEVMRTAPGELEFYRRAARDAASRGERVLDIGCGTGRISVEMANAGAEVVGMDLSPSILAVAREKTRDRRDIRFVQGDMVEFDLGERFGLVAMTGYAFHYATTPQAQLSCLASVTRHLHPNGVLVIHLDRPSPSWIAELRAAGGAWNQEADPLVDPNTGLTVRTVWSWTYEPKTETIFAAASWEFRGADGQPVERRQAEPITSHCYYRFEVEHLLRRSGFFPEHLYGDFLEGEYSDDSTTMVWAARLPGT